MQNVRKLRKSVEQEIQSVTTLAKIAVPFDSGRPSPGRALPWRVKGTPPPFWVFLLWKVIASIKSQWSEPDSITKATVYKGNWSGRASDPRQEPSPCALHRAALTWAWSRPSATNA